MRIFKTHIYDSEIKKFKYDFAVTEVADLRYNILKAYYKDKYLDFFFNKLVNSFIKHGKKKKIFFIVSKSLSRLRNLLQNSRRFYAILFRLLMNCIVSIGIKLIRSKTKLVKVPYHLRLRRAISIGLSLFKKSVLDRNELKFEDRFFFALKDLYFKTGRFFKYKKEYLKTLIDIQYNIKRFWSGSLAMSPAEKIKLKTKRLLRQREAQKQVVAAQANLKEYHALSKRERTFFKKYFPEYLPKNQLTFAYLRWKHQYMFKSYIFDLREELFEKYEKYKYEIFSKKDLDILQDPKLRQLRANWRKYNKFN